MPSVLAHSPAQISHRPMGLASSSTSVEEFGRMEILQPATGPIGALCYLPAARTGGALSRLPWEADLS